MAAVAKAISSRDQIRALLEIRVRMFWRNMKSADSKVTFIASLLLRLLVALGGVGAAVLAGVVMYFGLSTDVARQHPERVDHAVAFGTLWGVFLLWQLLVLLRASLAHNVGRELLRFPISFETYATLWWISGLTDYFTMVGALICLGMAIGAEWAGVPFLFALGVPALFFVFNLVVSRTIFVWLERLLAHRKTREVVLILLSMVGIVPQAMRMYTGSKHVHLPAWMKTLAEYLPPTFAFHALLLESTLQQRLVGVGLLLAVVVALFALIGMRLRKEYRGEDLHESAAAVAPVPAAKSSHSVSSRSESRSITLAVFENEVAKMKHSGMAMYQTFAPLLFIVIFGVRLAKNAPGWLLPGGLAYLTLTLAQAYNALGTDGPGFQIYRLAPVPLREVYLGKNLFTAGMFALQVIALFAIAAYMGTVNLMSVVFTLAFMVWALGIHLAVANVVSLKGAKRMDNQQIGMKSARMSTRRGNGGGWRGLLALLGVPAVGAGLVFGGVYLGKTWIAPALMIVCAAGAAYWYYVRLAQADDFKQEDMERALSVLTKTS